MYPHVLGDRYELLQRIGVGGMAQVYLAHDRLLGRNVAVKILSESGAQDPHFVERFRREAKAAAGLNHPNVVTIYDWGESATVDGDPLYFIVMEYVPGRNLKEVLRVRGSLSEVEALDTAAQIASALEAAHRRGLIHRDVKPHNVQIDPFGRAKVVDFGIAHAAGLSQLTVTNAVSGTAHYISPEQAQGLPIDPRSDVYSLGVVLYEMLTGAVPFEGESLIDVALRHVRDRPPLLRDSRQDVSPETEAIVLKAMEKDPARRFSSAAEMGAALERTRGRLSATSPAVADDTAIAGFTEAQDTAIVPKAATVRLGSLPVGPRPRLRAPSPGRAGWWMAVPVFVLLFALAAGVLYVGSRGPSHPTRQAAGPTPHPTHVAVAPRPSATPKPTARPTIRPSAVPTATNRPQPTATSAPAPTATGAPAPTVTPAPQPSAQVVAAANTSADPARTVERFYNLVSRHDFADAAQLWTSNMRSTFPPADNINGRFAGLQSVAIRQAHTTSQSSTSARVGVDVVLRFENQTQEYRGSWSLVPGGTGWLLAWPTLYQVG